jgi:hypothetical protein
MNLVEISEEILYPQIQGVTMSHMAALDPPTESEDQGCILASRLGSHLQGSKCQMEGLRPNCGVQTTYMEVRDPLMGV